MTGKSRTLLIWLGLIGIFVFLVLSRDSKTAQPTPFDTFRKLAAAGKIQEIWIDGNQIVFQIGNSGDRLSTTGFLDKDLEQTLEEGAAIHYGKPSSNNWFNDLSPTLLTLLVVIVVVVFLFRYAAKKRQGMFGDVFSMLKTRAMLIDSGKTVTFADVGGCADAKQSLRDVVDFLKDPKRWTAAGARLPRGVLLEGPPGCGKTLLARAVAGETNAKFYVVSASEFTEMFVGVGAARVRDMFETAVKNAPAIVFIDELDAIGRRRGSGVGSGHDEREQTLNQLLVCLDGFKGNDRVVVLAATNRPEILDQALLRPGRFDRLVRVPELSREARLAVLKIHTRNKPLAANLDLDEWADRSSGMNGAQLESLANEAALLAVRRQGNGDGESPTLGQDDFQQAWETIRPKSPQFDKLDEVLIEAATQLAKPTGRAFARLTLSDGATIEGEVLWVNATFIKILPVEDESAVIVPKRQVARLEALAGTEAADSLEVASDLWANRLPGTM